MIYQSEKKNCATFQTFVFVFLIYKNFLSQKKFAFSVKNLFGKPERINDRMCQIQN